MSEVKFPPRVFANEDIEDGIDFFEWSLSDTEGPQYLSLQEHNNLLSQLEERLLLAESTLQFYANRENWNPINYSSDCKEVITISDLGVKDFGSENNFADYSIPSGGRRAREALAAIKEKK